MEENKIVFDGIYNDDVELLRMWFFIIDRMVFLN
jgi:hypothetical protein